MSVKSRGFSIPELAICVVVLAALVALVMLARAQRPRRGAQRMENNTRLRGIHQGLVQYAQSNGQAFAGLGTDPTTYPDRNFALASERYRLLLDQNLFTGEYLVSPLEAGKTIWTTGPLTTANLSFALLDIAAGTAREKEWSHYDADTLAAIVSDRSKVIDPTLRRMSVHVSTKTAATNDWRGGVGWNDNHVSYEDDALVKTRYDELKTEQDDLFAEENGDGLMRFD